jgi:hypothetical protein
MSACQDGPDVETDTPLPGVAADGARMVADGLMSRLLDLAEALQTEPASSGDTPQAPAAAPAVVGESDGGGAIRSLVSLPSRVAADAAGAVAGAVVPRVVDRIDVNALLAKVDVDALVARVDVDRILDSIDPNRLLDRVDVDELIGRVDVGAVAEEALEAVDIGDLIQESTAGIGTEALEAVRLQSMRADDFLARIVDRVLFRKRPRDTALARPDATP